MNDNKTLIRQIPLRELSVSADNVRKVAASSEEDQQLIASIRAQGILQNLVVVSADCTQEPQEKWEVVAGQRRFSALLQLYRDGEITADYAVPCTVRPREDATAVSLSENIKASMHPADEFLAYKKLADEGRSETEIARVFGHSTTHVRKLMKLANVDPSLIDLYRRGEMDQECVMALTLTDDHERQRHVWSEVSRGWPSPHRIRQMLINEGVRSDDRLAAFVGVEHYKDQGGAVVSDLFESVTYLADLTLLEKLALEKLEQECEEVRTEGWKWVEPSMRYAHRGRQLAPDHEGVPEDLQKRIDDAEQELDELEDKPYTDFTDEDDARITELSEQLDDLLEEKNAYQVYTDKQKSYSGAYVQIDYSGRIQVVRGIVRPQDEPKDEADHAGPAESSDGTQRVESLSLLQDLKAYYSQAYQAVLMQREDLAFDVLVYSLGCQVLRPHEHHYSMLDFRANTASHYIEGMDETEALLLIEQTHQKLSTGWLEHEDEAEQFKAFQRLSKLEKMRIIAYCVARIAIPSPNRIGAQPIVEHDMDFRLSDYWRPTEENYFGRLKKSDLLNIGASVVGEEFRSKYATMKKPDLAHLIENLPEFKHWMPAYVQHVEGADHE